MPHKAPNILILMADQLAPQFLPAYGHPVVKTPNMTRLAEEGAVFDAAYCNAPLCAPARYVFMSGRLPSSIGAWDNAAEFPAEIPTYAHYLSTLGYAPVLSGKMHFCGPDQLHGFERRLTTDIYPADFTWTPNWDRPEEKLDWYHTMNVVADAGKCLRSSYLDYDDEVTFAAKRYLYDIARDDDAKPFCLTVSYIHPHDPYIARPEYWDLYENNAIAPPKVSGKDIEADPHSERLRKAIGADELEPTASQILAARRAYYANISYLDERMGEILQALEETGFAENTVIILTADHGDMLGERGLWFKMNWFEHSARVPLIVHAPATISPKRITHAVSLVDVLPTLVDLASEGKGYDFATPLEGRSLLPHLATGSGHDEVIGEYFGEGVDTPLFMIRRGSMKAVISQNDPMQLYDLSSDRNELTNLALAKNHQTLIAELNAEAENRWNTTELKNRVLESQRRRQFLAPIMRGQNQSWDYQPAANASQSYIRNTMSISAIERRSRFPRV